MIANTEKLSIQEKIGYGLGDTAANFIFQTMVVFQLSFYTDTYGIGAAAAGTLFMVVRVWDAIFDPLMGAAPGRRRPCGHARCERRGREGTPPGARRSGGRRSEGVRSRRRRCRREEGSGSSRRRGGPPSPCSCPPRLPRRRAGPRGGDSPCTREKASR